MYEKMKPTNFVFNIVIVSQGHAIKFGKKITDVHGSFKHDRHQGIGLTMLHMVPHVNVFPGQTTGPRTRSPHHIAHANHTDNGYRCTHSFVDVVVVVANLPCKCPAVRHRPAGADPQRSEPAHSETVVGTNIPGICSWTIIPQQEWGYGV